MVSGNLRGADTDTRFGGARCTGPKSPLKKEDEEELEAKLRPLNAPSTKFKAAIFLWSWASEDRVWCATLSNSSGTNIWVWGFS